MRAFKLVLLGYMGSGKTTIGNYLKHDLKYKLYDLDIYIEEKWNLNIPDIFQTKGELYFRKIERKALKEILDLRGPMIISLGGGTPCYYNNIDYINNRDETLTFYLKSSVDSISNRLLKGKNNRPLINNLKNIDEIKEYVNKHLFERNQFYFKAKHIISIDKKNPKTIAAEIKTYLT
tara:strand:- start:1014 stop:1544 length:531 start_codon:yes stop_codon:yes gene_type:complete